MNTATREESNALALKPPQQFDLSPKTFEQALTFSEYLAGSDMVPKAFRGKPGDCLIAMQWGYEVGLKPLQALQSIAVINGKPGIYGDSGKAILLNAGCNIEEDDTAIVKERGRARCKITRPGRSPVERTFSVDDAKTAGLFGKEGPWKTYPYRQMAWRAFWFAARDAASDLLRGLNGAEELVDYPTTEPKNMGAAEVVEPAAKPVLPACPQESFEKKLPNWRKNVEDGGNVADLLAMLQSKYTLAPDQIDAINALAIKPERSAEHAAFVHDMENAE